MAWITVTEAHLKTRMSGPELSGFRTAALASGQADPVASQIAQTVDLVRGYILACDNNALGPAGTVPEKLLGVTLDLLVVEVEKRCAGKLIDPQGHRAESARTAMSILRDVAACRFVIDLPETEDTEPTASSTPTITARAARFRDQEGI